MLPIASALPPFSFATLLLQDSGSGGGGLGTLLMFAGPLLIFWFLVIWPERKEKKRKAAMIENLKKNDRVLTTFGMYASVAAVNEGDLTLKLDDGNTRVRVLKSTIATVITPEGEDAGKDAGSAKA